MATDCVINLSSALISYVLFSPIFMPGDSEAMRILKFLKRSLETFGRNHGLQVALPKETDARVIDESGKCIQIQFILEAY